MEEGPFLPARESVQQGRVTAEVTRAGSLRARSGSLRRSSPTVDVCSENDDIQGRPAAAAGLCKDQSVQTSDELLQPLISDGLRRRRPATDDDHQGDSLGDVVEGVVRPWRRHSLESMSPLSSRLASPVDDVYRTQGPPSVLPAPRDLYLDDLLGDGGPVSRRSLSPLSIAEMTSPPRRRLGFELQPLDPYPLHLGDAGIWDDRHPLPVYPKPNYTVNLPPPIPQPARPTAAPPQRAPLRRQKPFLGAVKVHSSGPGLVRHRGVVAEVEVSPGGSSRDGGGRDGGESGSEGAGVKSLSTVSLEDAISPSIGRLSYDDDEDDNDVRARPRRLNLLTPHRFGSTRSDVTRNDVTGKPP